MDETLYLLKIFPCLLYSSGKKIIMDLILSVLCGMLDLRNLDVFASYLIKNRIYWPKQFPRNIMDDHMDPK